MLVNKSKMAFRSNEHVRFGVDLGYRNVSIDAMMARLHDVQVQIAMVQCAMHIQVLHPF